jgi:hypothetical protein
MLDWYRQGMIRVSALSAADRAAALKAATDDINKLIADIPNAKSSAALALDLLK